MTGMRKRVTAGFLSIVCLLFFSGMVSFLELSRLSRDTDEILGANQRSIRLAREMLDAVHGQSGAMARRAVFGDRSYDSLCRAGLERLEEVLLAAQKEAADRSALDSLAFATTGLRLLTDGFLASDAARRTDSLAVRGADSLGARWYRTEYGAYYDRLVSAINYYMTSTQSSLAPRAEQMKTNAYRAVTPVLISLADALLFHFGLLCPAGRTDGQGAGRLPLLQDALCGERRVQGRDAFAAGEDRGADQSDETSQIGGSGCG